MADKSQIRAAHAVSGANSVLSSRNFGGVSFRKSLLYIDLRKFFRRVRLLRCSLLFRDKSTKTCKIVQSRARKGTPNRERGSEQKTAKKLPANGLCSECFLTLHHSDFLLLPCQVARKKRAPVFAPTLPRGAFFRTRARLCLTLPQPA